MVRMCLTQKREGVGLGSPLVETASLVWWNLNPRLSVLTTAITVCCVGNAATIPC